MNGRLGPMGASRRRSFATESFWIDTWLRANYKGLEDALHHPRRGGARGWIARRSSTPGIRRTMISSAYKLCRDIWTRTTTRAPGTSTPSTSPTGTLEAPDDTRNLRRLLKGEILTKVNQFAYGQSRARTERPVHQGPARGVRRRRERGALGDRKQGRHLHSIKDFLGRAPT